MTFYDLNWENSNTLSCFVSKAERFSNNKPRGETYLNRYNFIEGEIIKTSEIIYKKTIDLSRFKNKKFLIIGGGPTTNWYNWDPEKYDFIFSCNHFFLNEKIKNTKVDLTLLGNELNPNREDFLNYIVENKTIIGIEDYWKPAANIKALHDKTENPIFPYSLRFQGKIGVAPKLIVLATLLGASHVDFVGIDGIPNKYNTDQKGQPSFHSFQKGKKFSTRYSRNLYRAHFKCLKIYLENEIGKGVTYRNLGKGHELNASGEIF